MAIKFLDSTGLTYFINKMVYGITSPKFSTGSTYTVGDFVIYTGKLYRCTTAVTVAGAWSASKWVQTTVKGEIKALNTNLGGLSFAQNADGKWGYKVAGADPVIPFKKLNRVSIGSGGNQTFSATSIPGYESLTADNFAFVVTSYSGGGGMTGSWNSTDVGYGTELSTSGTPSISYNSSTGIVTMSGVWASSSDSQGSSQGYTANKTATASIWGTVYCFY